MANNKDVNAPFFVPGEVIALTGNGTWLADGVEITHEPTRRLFARSIKKDERGYYIQVGREAKRIEVEDTPYFVQRVDDDGHGNYELSLNDETHERLDPSTLKYRPGRLSCQIKEGGEEAKFLHAPYFDLLRNLQEDESGYYLVFGEKKVRLAGK